MDSPSALHTVMAARRDGTHSDHRAASLARTEPRAPSKSQVNKAGRWLADHWTGALDLRPPDTLEAATVVDLWRQLHAEPMAFVTTEVGRRVEDATGEAVVAQRLKRMPQIIKKLVRLNKMELARMQDLGGCRAVVRSLDEVDHVARLLIGRPKPAWPLRTSYDYRENGKPDTAYRALHLVVQREGCLIEIQLRTMRQHVWAEAVERTAALSDHDVKAGDAPREILEYFRLTSDGFWLLDIGRSLSLRHVEQIRNLWKRVESYLSL
jgi:hypothetical protein